MAQGRDGDKESGEEKKVSTASWGDLEELGEKISEGEFEDDD